MSGQGGSLLEDRALAVSTVKNVDVVMGKKGNEGPVVTNGSLHLSAVP